MCRIFYLYYSWFAKYSENLQLPPPNISFILLTFIQVTSKLLLKDIGFKTEVSLDDAMKILHFWKMSEAPCMTRYLLFFNVLF